MVVLVFITNCQVSEKPNIGPTAPQITIIQKAVTKAVGEPVKWITAVENLLNNKETLLVGCFLFFRAAMVVIVS